ncbi:DUF6214 family protein [Streptomyces sp. NPDC005408]|uniref:DUF6214 family protein n=1 Tax=Streptomyces sp. NPDC005408 TaxID=3155341 RepID=UPI0033B480D4
MQETTFLNGNDQYDPDETLPYPPVWELHGAGRVTSEPGGHDISSPWFNVLLTFADGARIDVVAVVADGRIAIEDLRADPPLPLEGLAVLADRIEDPLEDACGVAAQQPGPVEKEPADTPMPGRRRARPAVPRGSAGRRIAADVYRAAQQEGRDPVLAVMAATGRSRRKALRLIAGARDKGYLAPRHNRRRTPPEAPGPAALPHPSQLPVTSSASG